MVCRVLYIYIYREREREREREIKDHFKDIEERILLGHQIFHKKLHTTLTSNFT